MTYGEVTYGEVTYGEVTYGEGTYGEVTYGEVTYGEVTLARYAFVVRAFWAQGDCAEISVNGRHRPGTRSGNASDARMANKICVMIVAFFAHKKSAGDQWSLAPPLTMHN